MVIVNTGDGKGKSTSAFGVMIRGIARGWNVAVVQFIKSGEWNVGEEKIGRQLGVDWFNEGEGFTWDSADIEHDKDLARAGMAASARFDHGRRTPARDPRRTHVPHQLGVDRCRAGLRHDLESPEER